MGFALSIVAIIVIGTVLVAFARKSRVDSDDLEPRIGQTWHTAFGVYQCDSYLPDLTDADDTNLSGINTFGDGLITIKPTVKASTGKGATFGKFADSVGITITDGAKVTAKLRDGTALNTGDKCKDSKGKDRTAELVLFVWPPQSTKSTEPEIVRSGIRDVRFTEDQQIMALALVPTGTKKIDLPSTSALKNPRTKSPTASTTTVPASTEVTTTTVAGATTTTQATTTTVSVTTTTKKK